MKRWRRFIAVAVLAVIVASGIIAAIARARYARSPKGRVDGFITLLSADQPYVIQRDVVWKNTRAYDLLILHDRETIVALIKHLVNPTLDDWSFGALDLALRYCATGTPVKTLPILGSRSWPISSEKRVQALRNWEAWVNAGMLARRVPEPPNEIQSATLPSPVE
jgi:hypothetical protein